MPSITVEQTEDMLFETKIGNHSLKIDVPAVMGGKDRGMDPPQLFLASVASCTAAFVAMYCKTAGINSKGLAVTLEFSKFQEPIYLGNFKMKIALPEGTKGKDAAILKAATHCPVHETLNKYGGMDIELI